MTLSIFAAILLAALLHALWNALAKCQAEGRVSVLLADGIVIWAMTQAPSAWW